MTGAIDATYIRLAKNPQEEGTSYINRKGFPGVSLQVVCDANRRIMDASTDSRILRKSSIGQHIDMLLHNTDYFLLADGGYTLLPRLMIPYRLKLKPNFDALQDCFYFIQMKTPSGVVK